VKNPDSPAMVGRGNPNGERQSTTKNEPAAREGTISQDVFLWPKVSNLPRTAPDLDAL
jgi:hypothetical protein